MAITFKEFMNEQLEETTSQFETQVSLLDDINIVLKIDKAASIPVAADRQLAVSQIMKEIQKGQR